MPFRCPIAVSFGDADPAGVLFFPNYFKYFHSAFEEFFRARFHPSGFRELIAGMKLGLPVVRAECDYMRPFPYGEVMDVTVSLVRVAERSATFRYEARPASDNPQVAPVHAIAQVTVAAIDLATFRSTPLPATLRALFSTL
jgi:4-hydroxybenzoyl-CoA thioesterase